MIRKIIIRFLCVPVLVLVLGISGCGGGGGGDSAAGGGVDDDSSTLPEGASEPGEIDEGGVDGNADEIESESESDSEGNSEGNLGGDVEGLNDPLMGNAHEFSDLDGDGIGDNSDTDRGGDGISNDYEREAGTDPSNASETPSDVDTDGIPDPLDSDRDGVDDQSDAFPDDINESADLDGDGIGDNRDTDRDGDGISNDYERQTGTDPSNANDTPADVDADGIPDLLDNDRDGDGVDNQSDAFPSDVNESSDLDGDGVGDNEDALPNDASETEDTDGDGVGDNADAFPHDFSEAKDSDGDGVGDNSDAFPNDAAASIDTDKDGYPSAWNLGFDPESSLTHLRLDQYPNNAACYLLQHGDGSNCNFDSMMPDYVPDQITSDDRIVYLLSQNDYRIYRWSVAESSYIYPLDVGLAWGNSILPPTYMTYSPDHQRLYLGYHSGTIRFIDIEGDGNEILFAETKESLRGIAAVGSFVLAEDISGFSGTHYVFDVLGKLRGVNERSGYSSVYAWNNTLSRVYFFRDYTGPNDLLYEEINRYTGEIVSNGESPYHGLYSILPPIRISNDDQTILLGSGDLYNAEDLIWKGSVGASMKDALWLSDGSLVTLRAEDDHTVLQRLDTDFVPSETLIYDGEPRELVSTAAGIVVLTVIEGNTVIRKYGSSDDADNDGVSDVNDEFPLDSSESIDTDNDGVGDNADNDDDGDNVVDMNDVFPLDAAESADTDLDGVGNNADEDDDGDGVIDIEDAFPLDSNESADTDGDTIGDNADNDDDGDGVIDSKDLFPLDADEYLDTDNDGVGDNGDVFPFDVSESADTDFDGIGNNADPDDDNDGVLDSDDALPLEAAESVDTDGDGIGNNADLDDDNDGVLDSDDAFPLDNDESVDTDHDGRGDRYDSDDDNDGVNDWDDAFPLDLNESVDTDNDGIGNNADEDDDNDGVLDVNDNFPEEAGRFIEYGFDIEKVLYDSLRHKFYILDANAWRIYFIDLNTFEIEHSIGLEQFPTDFIMFDNKLYITQGETASDANEPVGKIVVVDLDQQTNDETIDIALNPLYLAATDDNRLLISSRNQAGFGIYNLTTQVFTGPPLLTGSPSPDWFWVPSENAIYAIRAGSPRDIEKYSTSTSLIEKAYDSVYHGDYAMGSSLIPAPNYESIITESGNVFSISANEAMDLQYIGSFGEAMSAMVADSKRNTLLTVTSYRNRYGDVIQNYLNYYNLTTYEKIGEIELDQQAEELLLVGDEVYYFTSTDDASIASAVEYRTSLGVLNHPCLDCGDNASPTASFQVLNDGNSNVDAIFSFDASNSFDGQDETALLQFRWDWDSDGVYDTEYSNEPITRVQFNYPGTKFITLTVKDTGGLTAEARVAVDVFQDLSVEDDGAVWSQLQFPVTEMVHDEQRGTIYASSMDQRRLYSLDAVTGLVTNVLEFEDKPERLALNHRGDLLYVALVTAQHSLYWGDEDQTGRIAVIDLESGVVVDVFELDIDPYDIVVTAGNQLVVSGGSGQHTRMQSYDASTGELVGIETRVHNKSVLVAHPENEWIFANASEAGKDGITKFDLSGGRIAEVYDLGSSYNYNIDHRLFMLPSGKVLTRGGDVFDVNSFSLHVSYEPALSLSDGGINNLVVRDNIFVAYHQFFVGGKYRVAIYDADSINLLDYFSLSGDIDHLYMDEKKIYTLTVPPASNFTLIRRYIDKL